jgi:glucarate dehydratase
MVGEARRMINTYGFGSIKLKGGVFAPEEEIRALDALRGAFPGLPLRIDPNGGWSVETTRRVMPALAANGLLEYLEDPCSTLQEMGEVAKFAQGMPLATNMVTIAFGHIPETLRLNAVQVILSDHHYWGGLRATQQLAPSGALFGLGISMHSNSHLGISLAAMTHVGVTIPNLRYACDTHYPWQVDEAHEIGFIGLGIMGTPMALPPASTPATSSSCTRAAAAAGAAATSAAVACADARPWRAGRRGLHHGARHARREQVLFGPGGVARG